MKPPKTWPASLEDVLRIVIRRRHADRLRIYKRFVAEGMRFDIYMHKYRFEGKDMEEVPEPTREEVEKVVAGHAATGFTEGQFAGLAESFRRWEPRILQLRAEAAAKARWGKEKLKRTKQARKRASSTRGIGN